MALLRDNVTKQGSFLFRWRSFLPLLLAGIALLAIHQSTYLEIDFGEYAERICDVLSVLAAFGGLAIRVATVGFVTEGTSGRNTKAQRADVLNTTGLYSVVRNPLYVGNIMTLLGFLLAVKVWWLVVVGLAIAVLYYERIIMAEEAYLTEKFGADYEQWAARTPALIPNLRHWQRPALPFSWKMAVRREQNGFLVIVLVLTAFAFLTDSFAEMQPVGQWVRGNPGWSIFFAVGMLIYVAVRVIYKTTNWLETADR